MQRLAELDGHLWEAQALPAAHAGGAVDRDWNHRSARLQCYPANPGLNLAQLTGPGTTSLRVHEQHFPPLEDREGGLERFLVMMATTDWEDAAVRVDVGEDGRAEHLRLRHEADLAAQVEPCKEVIHLAEVVRGKDQRPRFRHVLDPDRPGPVEQEGRQRDERTNERIGPADALARPRVEAVEVLGN